MICLAVPSESSTFFDGRLVDIRNYRIGNKTRPVETVIAVHNIATANRQKTRTLNQNYSTLAPFR